MSHKYRISIEVEVHDVKGLRKEAKELAADGGLNAEHYLSLKAPGVVDDLLMVFDPGNSPMWADIAGVNVESLPD